MQHIRWFSCRFTLLRAAESAERNILHEKRVIPESKVVGSVIVIHQPATFRLASAWFIAAISRISWREKWRIVLCVIANITDLDCYLHLRYCRSRTNDLFVNSLILFGKHGPRAYTNCPSHGHCLNVGSAASLLWPSLLK